MNFYDFKRYLLVLVLFGNFIPGVMATEKVTGLYQALVDVDSNSPHSLATASSQGLADVFTKVSGRKSAADHPLLTAELNNAKQYLLQYRFKKMAFGQQVVVLNYDAGLINTKLKQANLPIWSENRPSVLFIAVIEQGNKKRLLTPETDADVLASVERAAQRRGIPVKIPLFDLQDSTSFSANDVWQLNDSVMSALAARYNYDSLLMAKINSLSDERWMGVWQVKILDDIKQFQGFKNTPSEFIDHGIDSIADQLAKQFSTANSQQLAANEIVTIQLTGLTSFSDYRRALNILESLDVVKQLTPQSFAGDQVVLSVKLADSQQQLKKSLRLFEQFTHDESIMGSANQLNYRWSK